MNNTDVFGNALLDYFNGKENTEIVVESDIAETETWPVEIFFRNYAEMPKLEKVALKEVKGKILDIGAGAGSHSLMLQENNFDITAIDISKGAVDVMQKRGLKNVIYNDFFNLQNRKFDTLLLLMNGIGIVGAINNLNEFFAKAKDLLNDDGIIILDSSDLIYLYDNLEGLPNEYYGELKYTFIYDNQRGKEFSWLFIDYETLKIHAENNGFRCKMIYEDNHFSYLAKVSLI